MWSLLWARTASLRQQSTTSGKEQASWNHLSRRLARSTCLRLEWLSAALRRATHTLCQAALRQLGHECLTVTALRVHPPQGGVGQGPGCSAVGAHRNSTGPLSQRYGGALLLRRANRSRMLCISRMLGAPFLSLNVTSRLRAVAHFLVTSSCTSYDDETKACLQAASFQRRSCSEHRYRLKSLWVPARRATQVWSTKLAEHC